MRPLRGSRIRASAVIALAAAVILAGAATGCTTLSYYWQAAGGQLAMTRAARPLDEVIEDRATDADLRARLQQVREIRAFASRELGLPDNGSYRRYADLQRPYVVWNVFAAPELAVEAVTWCFPIAGCVGYRGYFAEADARRFAEQLSGQGLDVYVGGVPAYSTLGWFDDPVLNTFVHYPRTELARLIFHELSHQVVYAPGDSMFNESFAVTVENEGVRRWIDRHGSPEQRSAYQAAQLRRREFAELVARYRERFATLYAGADGTAAKRAGKAALQQEMRADYARLKAAWGGFGGYDRWFEQPLNNAQLASVAIYTQLVPGFERLLQESAGNLPQFYAQVEALAKLPVEARRARLAAAS